MAQTGQDQPPDTNSGIISNPEQTVPRSDKTECLRTATAAVPGPVPEEKQYRGGQKDQAACKPGSVPRTEVRGGDHSSAAGLADGLVRPTRMTCGDARAAEAALIPIRSCSRWGLPSPLPCGRGGALLPHPFTLTRPEGQAVCSLLRFPWGHPRRTLSGTLSPWSPDFPRRRRFRTCRRGRPAT